MAKMSRAQYELLTEAMGEGLADVQKTGVKMLEPAAMTMIHRLADNLAYDNPNFDTKLFVQRVKAQAELATVLQDMDIDIA